MSNKTTTAALLTSQRRRTEPHEGVSSLALAVLELRNNTFKIRRNEVQEIAENGVEES